MATIVSVVLFILFWPLSAAITPQKKSVQHTKLPSVHAQWGRYVYTIRVGTGEVDSEPAAYLNCTRTSWLGSVVTQERWITARMLTVLLKTTATSRNKGVQGLASKLGRQSLPVRSLAQDHDRFIEDAAEWEFDSYEEGDRFRSLMQDVAKCVCSGHSCRFDSRGIPHEDDDEYACVSQQALASERGDLC